jgi:single-stranded-DNA-specific exonuclease
MAAGLTIDADKVDALAEWLDDRLARDVAEASADRMLAIDALISPRGLNPLFVDAMEAGGPYGTGWPGPRIVAGPVRIVKCDIVGKDHVRAIVSGDDGASFSPPPGERCWGSIASMRPFAEISSAGRAADASGATPKAELLLTTWQADCGTCKPRPGS